MTDTSTYPRDHNHPPETIEEVVRLAQQTRDNLDRVKDMVDAAEAPFKKEMAEATKALRAEADELEAIYDNAVAKIARWQESQRKSNPFADPKEMSRVIIDGEVAATVRTMEGYEIIKADMVPRDLCKPDDNKIKVRLVSSKEEIPGIRRRVRYGTMVR